MVKRQEEIDSDVIEGTSKAEYSAIYQELNRRDNETEYFTDDRSGEDQVTDSEDEFERIVQVDQLLTRFSEIVDVVELPELLESLHKISKLVDFENESLWKVFDAISPNLLDITSLPSLVRVARLAFEMELPYQSFWAGLINVLLLNHQDFSVDGHDSLIDFTYYIVRGLLHGTSAETTQSITNLMQLDAALLPARLAKTTTKLAKKA